MKYPVDPLLTAVTTVLPVADYLLNTKRYHPAIEFFKESLTLVKISENLNSESHDSLKMELQDSLANALSFLGEFDESAETYPELTKNDSDGSILDGRVDFKTAVSTALQVAKFLWNIKRYYPATAFLKESLILVKISENYCRKVFDREKLEIVNSLINAYLPVGKYDELEEYIELALETYTKQADKEGELRCCHNLYTKFSDYGRYDKAMKYLERALLKEIRFAQDVASIYCDIGIVHYRLGQYQKAIERLLTSLEFNRAARDGQLYSRIFIITQLTHVICSLGMQNELVQKLEEALQILDESEEGEDMVDFRVAILFPLGIGYREMGRYDKVGKSLIELFESMGKTGVSDGMQEGEKEKEAYICLWDFFVKALEKARETDNCTSDMKTSAEAFAEFEEAIFPPGQPDEATESFEKRSQEYMLAIMAGKRPTATTFSELRLFVSVGNEDIRQALDVWCDSVRHCESEGRLNLEDKLSLGDKLLNIALHKYHCHSLIELDRPIDALRAVEQGRARVLGESLAKKYNVQVQKVVFSFKSLMDFVNLLKKDQIIVYMAAVSDHTFFWVIWLDEEGPLLDLLCRKESPGIYAYDVLESTVVRNFRSLNRGLNITCEDRSLSGMYDLKSSVDDEDRRRNVERLIEDDEEYENTNEPNQLYNMLVAPYAHRIAGAREVVLVPEGPMFLVPFPSLQDAEDNYISEKFWIRVIPSLTTLKLITDSAPDYHSRVGALIVGDPDVSRVRGLGRLPAARQEAKEIAQLLNVSPLLGEQATKEEVLRRITDVCVIHIAAHGDVERGEIACAPNPSSTEVLRKQDFMLTMEDIAKVGIRAKLVVLSCCHSGRGEIVKTEGVVGIARAFIASGARSVLVALWHLDDRSTKEFMIRFYGHLTRDKLSASEALHQSMKWMRETKRYSVSVWAPFLLIGDNVTLDL